jgi:hypothetical protein
VLRYAPTHERAPKMLAARGTRLGLVPHPAAEPSEWVVLAGRHVAIVFDCDQAGRDAAARIAC